MKTLKWLAVIWLGIVVIAMTAWTGYELATDPIMRLSFGITAAFAVTVASAAFLAFHDSQTSGRD